MQLVPDLQKQKNPKDMVLCFACSKKKEEILKLAWTSKALLYKDCKKQIFQELAPETIRCWKESCPYTQHLQEEGVKYKWGFPFCLQVISDGVVLSATNKTGMEDLLQKLKTDLSIDMEHLDTAEEGERVKTSMNQKCKIQQQSETSVREPQSQHTLQTRQGKKKMKKKWTEVMKYEKNIFILLLILL